MNIESDKISVIGRLLEEVSWDGAMVRRYRKGGGRGYENVLTAEALQGLNFLPRTHFWASVLAHAHGADMARSKLMSEIEDARFTLLPGNQKLIPSGDRHQSQLPVQPDGIIESANTFTIVEAKRIRGGSFQPQQLAREYVLVLRDAGERTPILLLIIGSPPPVKVTKHGRLQLAEAISLHLDDVLAKAENCPFSSAQALDQIDDVVCWVTWEEIAQTVSEQLQALHAADPSVYACIGRIAHSVTDAISWHNV